MHARKQHAEPAQPVPPAALVTCGLLMVASAAVAMAGLVVRSELTQQIAPVLALLTTCLVTVALAELGAARPTFTWLAWCILALCAACNVSILGNPKAASMITTAATTLGALSLAAVKTRLAPATRAF
jgi:hypothetical protein